MDAYARLPHAPISDEGGWHIRNPPLYNETVPLQLVGYELARLALQKPQLSVAPDGVVHLSELLAVVIDPIPSRLLQNVCLTSWLLRGDKRIGIFGKVSKVSSGMILFN